MKYLILFLVITGSTSSYGQDVNRTNDIETHKVIRKNSLHAEGFGYSLFFVSANYERSFRMVDKMYLGLRGGVAYSFGFQAILELNVFFLGPKHFIEGGIGTCTLSAWHFSDEPGDDYFKISNLQPSGRIGYRYQGTKGFLIKTAPYFFNDGDKLRIWPSASLGYSF